MNAALTAWWGFEVRTTRFWNRLGRHEATARLFGAVSRLGDGVFWYVLIASLAAFDGVRGALVGGRMLAAGLCCTLLYKGIKLSVKRARPCHVLPDLFTTVPPLDRFSFPSGHTMHATAFTCMACAAYPALVWLLLPFTGAVALSRMILGLHYPTDVAAGALFGGFVAQAARALPF